MNQGFSKIETFRFRVEPFHVDLSGRLFLGVLGNHLLNAADHHSSRRGFGIAFLMENHYTWVLSRLSVEMDEWPRQYEEVEVETWVESVMKLFTERNFLIRNARDGRIYGYARSIWAMINTETRHPEDLLTLHDGAIVQWVMTPEEKGCPIEKNHARVRFTDDVETRVVATHYSDVDINGHINSIKYIEHILDLFPREQFEQHCLQRFDIAYKTESYLGDTLTFALAVAETGDPGEVRKNVGSTEKPAGEVVVQAQVKWKRITP